MSGALSGRLIVGVRMSQGMPFFLVRFEWVLSPGAASLVSGGGAIIGRAKVFWRRLQCCIGGVASSLLVACFLCCLGGSLVPGEAGGFP